MHPSPRWFGPLSACFVTLAAAYPCSAQLRVEFTPFAGAYLARTNFATLPPAECLSDFPIDGCGGGVVRQKNAAIVGGQITGWLGKRLALDISAGYSWSGMVSQPYQGYAPFANPGVASDTSGHLFTGSARLLITVTPPTAPASLYLSAGWAFVSHDGDGYRDAPTDRGPVVGAGARLALTPAVAPRVELQCYTGPGADIGRFRGDLVLSMGLSATLFRVSARLEPGAGGSAPQQSQ